MHLLFLKAPSASLSDEVFLLVVTHPEQLRLDSFLEIWLDTSNMGISSHSSESLKSEP